MRKTTIAARLGLGLVALGGPALAAPPDGGSHVHHDAGPKETPGQREYRVAYLRDTLEKEKAITRHHVWTPAMSTASWKHWRRAYKALRIRELAQDDSDDAAVVRVDAYLKKVTDHFVALLTELTASAPEVPPPPTLLSPAEGATAAVGTPVTFKMAPYKDAAHYYCWFWEPGGHHWSNWQTSTESYGTSPECTVPADDAHWIQFRSGKAEFYGRAIVPVKADGKEYKMWSEPVKLEVTITGGASGAGPAGKDGGSR